MFCFFYFHKPKIKWCTGLQLLRSGGLDISFIFSEKKDEDTIQVLQVFAQRTC